MNDNPIEAGGATPVADAPSRRTAGLGLKLLRSSGSPVGAAWRLTASEMLLPKSIVGRHVAQAMTVTFGVLAAANGFYAVTRHGTALGGLATANALMALVGLSAFALAARQRGPKGSRRLARVRLAWSAALVALALVALAAVGWHVAHRSSLVRLAAYGWTLVIAGLVLVSAWRAGWRVVAGRPGRHAAGRSITATEQGGSSHERDTQQG